MYRRVALGVLFACLLVLVPSASAAGWQPVATGLTNIVQPALLRTAAGTELVAWNTPNGSLRLLRNGTSETLLSGLPFVGKPALVQQPNGALQLYVPAEGNGLDGVVRLSSTDDGATWAAPVQTASHDLADVGSAAVRPDGTPLFTQSGTGFVNVFQGLNGQTVTNVFPACCGYAESVSVDSANVARVAFWSNATAAPNRFVVVTLGGKRTTYGTQTAPRDDQVHAVGGRLSDGDVAEPPALAGQFGQARPRELLRRRSAHGARARAGRQAVGSLDEGRTAQGRALADERRELRRHGQRPRSIRIDRVPARGARAPGQRRRVSQHRLHDLSGTAPAGPDGARDAQGRHRPRRPLPGQGGHAEGRRQDPAHERQGPGQDQEAEEAHARPRPGERLHADELPRPLAQASRGICEYARPPDASSTWWAGRRVSPCYPVGPNSDSAHAGQ